MVETETRESLEESISVLMDTELKTYHGKWCLHKKREAGILNNFSIQVSTVLDLSVSIGPLKRDGTAVNQSEIFLLPEELPVFTSALLRHPVLFPSSYSQQVAMVRGQYCLRMKSIEAPKGFVQRLSESLQAL